MDARNVLEHFLASGEIARVYREDLEDGWADGYVTACGPEWFVLELFDKACRLDGLFGMRYADVSECKAAPHALFLENALAARKMARRSDQPLDVSSTLSLISSAGNVSPLVALHLDDDGEGYCYIGRILAVTEKDVRYLSISPDAKWEAEPETCFLGAIVGVGIGGAYEEALFLVSGRS